MPGSKAYRQRRSKQKAAALRDLPVGTVITMKKYDSAKWRGLLEAEGHTSSAVANGITGLGATLAHKWFQERKDEDRAEVVKVLEDRKASGGSAALERRER